MRSRGDCFDNAVAESFFATLKKELIHGRSWPSKAELSTEVHPERVGRQSTGSRSGTTDRLNA
jgi:transposase InsO family protein